MSLQDHPLYAECNTLQALREQNRKLKEAARCVICQDSPRSRLFLPCAHFAYCQYCAPSLTRCCYRDIKTNVQCKQLIQGIVHVYR